MQDTMRIGAAAVGGYVLGRTKKAKAAIGLALWLSGRRRPRDMARDEVAKLLQSERGQQLLGELRGPVMEAGKRAALAVFEAQAGKIGDTLQQRTEKLGGTIEAAGSGAAGGASRTATKLMDKRKKVSATADSNGAGQDESEDDDYAEGYDSDDEYDEHDRSGAEAESDEYDEDEAEGESEEYEDEDESDEYDDAESGEDEESDDSESSEYDEEEAEYDEDEGESDEYEDDSDEYEADEAGSDEEPEEGSARSSRSRGSSRSGAGRRQPSSGRGGRRTRQPATASR